MKGSLFIFVCVVGSCFGQQEQVIDKAYWGVWNLDVAKSKFAPPPGSTPPKSVQVIVNQNGYISTQQGATNSPPAVALALVKGECFPVGPFSPTDSCTITMDGSKKPTITLKLATATIKIQIVSVDDT